MNVSPLSQECMLSFANIVADSRSKYKMYNKFLPTCRSESNDDDVGVLLQSKNNDDVCVYTLVYSKDIIDEFKLRTGNISKFNSFVENAMKRGSFPVLWKSGTIKEFAVIKVNKNICDKTETEEFLKLEVLLIRKGKCYDIYLNLISDVIEAMKNRSRYSAVTESEDVRRKFLNTNTKYTCASCGESSKKMNRCSILKKSYYCNRE